MAVTGLHATGELLALHDAYRAAAVPANPASVPVAAVTITWTDGTVITAYPPETPARPADATPVNCPRG
jgi:hypothetical protein